MTKLAIIFSILFLTGINAYSSSDLSIHAAGIQKQVLNASASGNCESAPKLTLASTEADASSWSCRGNNQCCNTSGVCLTDYCCKNSNTSCCIK